MSISAERAPGSTIRRSGRAPAFSENDVPALASGVELLGRVEGSGYDHAPSLARRADGQNVQLTPLLFELLGAIDGRRNHDELAAALEERTGRAVTADDVSFLVDQKLRPLGVLQDPGGAEPALEAPNPLLALRLKYVVSDPAVTRRIAAVFAPLFHPVIVAAFTAAFLFALGWMVVEKGLASAFHHAIYEPGLLLVVLALTIVSAAFHELGHAAACRYSGADPGAMGVGLYLVWPAFYTDVTDSYRLDRRSRLRVDLGGIYFNAIFAVATVVTSVAVGWDALLLVVAAQLYLMVRQLIPIVRFDGYHVLADLVGVPDLFRHIKPTLLSAFRRGRDASVRLRPWARRVVTAWVLAVVPLLAAMLLFVVLLLPRILATAADSFALQWDAAASEWRAADVTAVASACVSMLLIALPMVGIPYMIGRLGWRAGHSTWHSTAGRPAARAAVALGGLAVLGALAWAWWPHDQYRPLEPTERWGLASSVRALPQGEAVLAAVPVVERDTRPKRAFMVALMTTLPDGSAGPIVVVAPGLDPPDEDALEAATETVAAQTTPTPTTTATPTTTTTTATAPAATTTSGSRTSGRSRSRARVRRSRATTRSWS